MKNFLLLSIVCLFFFPFLSKGQSLPLSIGETEFNDGNIFISKSSVSWDGSDGIKAGDGGGSAVFRFNDIPGTISLEYSRNRYGKNNVILIQQSADGNSWSDLYNGGGSTDWNVLNSGLNKATRYIRLSYSADYKFGDFWTKNAWWRNITITKSLSVSATSLPDMNTAGGTSATHTFTVNYSNPSGNILLTSTNPDVMLTPSQLNVAGQTGSATITVSFTPQSIQNLTTTLKITDEGYTSNSQSITVNTVCNSLTTPELQNPTDVSSHSFTVNWGSIVAASEYILKVKENGNVLDDIVVEGDKTSQVFSDLKEGSQYIYTVTAAGGSDPKVYSEPSQEGVVTTPMYVPETTNATDIYYTAFTANWTGVEGAAGYLLTVTKNGEVLEGYNDKRLDADVSSFRVEGLEQGITYSYFVKAISGFNEAVFSDPSDAIEATTLLLASPIALDASDLYYSSFTANWETSQDATSYLLSVYNGDVVVEGYDDLNVGNVTSFKVEGLMNSSSYLYTVKGVGGINSEVFSVASNAIVAETLPFSSPVSEEASEVDFLSFTANWTEVESVETYLLTVFKDGTPLEEYNDLVVQNSTSYRVTGLSHGTEYCYSVKGVHPKDNSVVSAPSDLITVTTTLLSSPVANEATDQNYVSFTANWEKTNDATDYLLFVTHNGKFLENFNGIKTGNVTHFKVDGLNQNTEYKYFVQALRNIDGTETVSNNSDSISVTTTKLNAPTASDVSDVYYTAFTANWEAVPEATAYLISVLYEGNVLENYNDLNVGNVTSYRIEGLQQNGSYTYMVKSFLTSEGSDVISDASNEVLCSTLTLNAPKALAATDIYYSSFTANWEAVPEATAYLLSVSQNGVVLEGYNDLLVSDATSFDVTGLMNGCSFRYAVKSVGGNNNEVYSIASDSIDVVTPAFNAPTATEASEVDYTSFTANWDVVENVSEYRLSVFANGSVLENYNEIPVTNGTSLKVEGLTHGQIYSYSVKCVNPDDHEVVSAASNSIEVHTLLLNAPVVLAAEEVDYTSFTAHWETVEEATAYKVTVVSNGDTLEHYNNRLVEGSVSSLKIDGLNNGSTYIYDVKSIRVINENDTVVSAPSSDIEVSTLLLAAPNVSAASEIYYTSFSANWESVADAEDYMITVSRDGQAIEGYENLLTGNVNSLRIEGLEQGISYSYCVKSVRGEAKDILSAPSATIDVTTLLLATPESSAASDVYYTSFTANWGAIEGANYYLVSVFSGNDVLSSYNRVKAESNSLAITGLEQGVTYGYSIEAVGGNEDEFVSIASNRTDVTTLLLSTPSVEVSSTYYDSFTLDWETIGDALYYMVTISLNGNILGNYNDFIVADETSVRIEGLAQGMTYQYAIKAVSGKNEEIVSPSVTGDVTTLHIDVPESMDASDVRFESFTANWGVAEGANYYELTVQEGDVILEGYNNLRVNGTAQSVTGLKQGTTYSYSVRAIGGEANEVVSRISNSIVVKTLALSSPIVLPASAIQFESFTANWEVTEHADYYELTVKEGDITLEGYNNLRVDGTEHHITRLKQGTTYSYSVRAVAHDDPAFIVSETSASEEATTLLLEAPVALNAEDISVSGFTAKWEASPNATSYRLTIKEEEGSFEVVYTTDELSFSVTENLEPNRAYVYWVEAIAGEEDEILSDVSNPIIVITLPVGIDNGSLSSALLNCRSYGNQLFVENISDIDVTIMVFNTSGQLVFNKVIPEGETISIDGISGNVYLIKGVAGDRVYETKVLCK